MAHLIENLLNDNAEISIGNNDNFETFWVVAKPEIHPFISRLKDAIGVLRGKYQAVYFVDDLSYTEIKNHMKPVFIKKD